MADYKLSYTGTNINEYIRRAGLLDSNGKAPNSILADTATKLVTPRTISLSGLITGSGNFDGSSNITIPTTFTPPVGAVVCMSTNTNPNSYYGGTWELIDKEFTPLYLSDASLATRNTTNCTSIDSFYMTRTGHSVKFTFSFTNEVAITDTALEMFTINLSRVGVSSLSAYARFSYFTDGANSDINMVLGADGTLSTVDVITKNSTSSTVAAKTGLSAGTAPTFVILQNHMLDSACNKFYFKRTA